MNSPTGSCLIIYAAACFETLNVPTTLIFNTLIISSVGMVPLFVTKYPAEITPAELTTTFNDPNSYTVYFIKAITFSSFETSVLKNLKLYVFYSAKILFPAS